MLQFAGRAGVRLHPDHIHPHVWLEFILGFSQDLEDRGGIFVSKTHGHRPRVNGLSQGEKRGLAADLIGKFRDDSHVLLPGRYAHRGRLIDTFRHHRGTHLEHARSAGAWTDHLHNLHQIQASAFGQSHRLRGSDIVNRHEVVRDKFHLAAVAIGAEIYTLLGKVGKQAGAINDGGAVAARINDQIAILGLSAGAAQRAIQRQVSSLRQNALELKLIGNFQRAELDDNFGRLTGLRDFPGDVVSGGWAGKARHDHRRMPCKIVDAVNDDHLIAQGFRLAGWIYIESVNGPAALDEVAGNGATHDSESGDPDYSIHQRFLLLLAVFQDRDRRNKSRSGDDSGTTRLISELLQRMSGIAAHVSIVPGSGTSPSAFIAFECAAADVVLECIAVTTYDEWRQKIDMMPKIKEGAVRGLRRHKWHRSLLRGGRLA